VVFLKALDDVSVEERGILALQCEVSDPKAHVVWHKDGVQLDPSDKYNFLNTAGTRGLVIHDLSREDTGLYTCHVGTEETRARVSVHGTSSRAWPELKGGWCWCPGWPASLSKIEGVAPRCQQNFLQDVLDVL
jgi:hypothetical protein